MNRLLTVLVLLCILIIPAQATNMVNASAGGITFMNIGKRMVIDVDDLGIIVPVLNDNDIIVNYNDWINHTSNKGEIFIWDNGIEIAYHYRVV